MKDSMTDVAMTTRAVGLGAGDAASPGAVAGAVTALPAGGVTLARAKDRTLNALFRDDDGTMDVKIA